MENEVAKISKIAGGLERSLELPEDIFHMDSIQTENDFHNAVIKVVKAMIENNFERFLSMMYRMDISEIKLKSAINTPHAEDVYSKVADLIISREAEKIFWRDKYKN